MMDDRSESPRPRPARAAARQTRYECDLYSWAIEQAELLRAGNIAEADALNIAEELDDVGNEQYDKLQSALRLILLHLLKWDHQARRRSRSWWASIAVQRNQVIRLLRKNPGLKARLDEAIAEAFEDARIQAAAQTSLGIDAFPPRCPYGWQDIIEREIVWPRKE
jgi:hypothetical protein